MAAASSQRFTLCASIGLTTNPSRVTDPREFVAGMSRADAFLTRSRGVVLRLAFGSFLLSYRREFSARSVDGRSFAAICASSHGDF